MPNVGERQLSPDEALKEGRCPECGRDFKQVSPLACLNTHWPREPQAGSDGDEARRRRDMLRDHIVSTGFKDAETAALEAKSRKAQTVINPAQ